MKDNDFFVSEFYWDLVEDGVIVFSVYFIFKISDSGNWIEIVYGISLGGVWVIV